MKVFLTGATGQVGRAILRRLRADGLSVHAIYRGDAPPPATEGPELVRGDGPGIYRSADDAVRFFPAHLGDPNAMAAAATGCDVAIHAAREATHGLSLRDIGLVNVAGTENALAAARHAGCRRFVHIGCVDVTLDNRDRVNWNEDRTLGARPDAPHARSELEAEELVVGLGNRQMPTIVLRAATVWGPDDRRLLPRLAREAASGGVTLVGKGENLVSTCHADNIASAARLAAASEAAEGGIFHVTDDELTLARDFYGGLCEALGVAPPRRGPPVWLAALRARFGIGELSPVDVIHRGRSTTFDIRPAREILGYRPVVSVSEGLDALGEAVRRRAA